MRTPAFRPRRVGPRATVAVIAVAVLGLAVLAAGLWWHRPPSLNGPLTLGDTATETGLPVDVGQTATFGGLVLKHRGGKPAVIDAVDLVPDGAAAATRLVDVRIVNLVDVAGPLTGTATGFTPPAASIAARGAAVRPTRGPRDGYELLLGVQVLQPGRARLASVRIDYHIGRSRYRLIAPHSFVLCAPKNLACAPT